MKRLATLILAVPLFLAGCTGSPDANTPPEAIVSSTSATPTTPTGPMDTDLGQVVTDNCAPAMPCEIEFQVTDIRVSDVCETGLAEYFDPIEEGQLLLTVEGEANAIKTMHDGHFHTFDGPSYEDAEGYSTSGPNVMDPCNSHEGDLWADPLDEGTQKRMIDTWIMPSDATHMVFAGHRYELPEATSIDTPPISTSAAAGTTSEAVAAEEPYVVECIFGTPGPSRMSDGTMIYTDHCFHEMGGPAYLEGERAANDISYSDWYSTDGAAGFRDEQSEMIGGLNDQYSEYNQEYYIDEDGYVQLRGVTD